MWYPLLLMALFLHLSQGTSGQDNATATITRSRSHSQAPPICTSCADCFHNVEVAGTLDGFGFGWLALILAACLTLLHLILIILLMGRCISGQRAAQVVAAASVLLQVFEYVQYAFNYGRFLAIVGDTRNSKGQLSPRLCPVTPTDAADACGWPTFDQTLASHRTIVFLGLILAFYAVVLVLTAVSLPWLEDACSMLDGTKHGGRKRSAMRTFSVRLGLSALNFVPLLCFSPALAILEMVPHNTFAAKPCLNLDPWTLEDLSTATFFMGIGLCISAGIGLLVALWVVPVVVFGNESENEDWTFKIMRRFLLGLAVFVFLFLGFISAILRIVMLARAGILTAALEQFLVMWSPGLVHVVLGIVTLLALSCSVDSSGAAASTTAEQTEFHKNPLKF